MDKVFWKLVLASNIVANKQTRQCNETIWVNETDNTSHSQSMQRDNSQKFENSNDAINRIIDVRHYSRSYKLYEMRNIG